MSADNQQPIDSGFGRHTTARDVLAGQDLSGKTALITGGYSGLGLEAVRALAGAGARVIVPARRPEAAVEALNDLGEAVSVARMDLADLASVEAFTRDLLDSGTALDIVINNAAIMACPETRVGPGWEAQFATNHIGHFAMTRALMPLMLKANAPRLVSLSSIAHRRSDIHWDDIHFERRPYDKWQAYAQAKTANALFAVGLMQQYGGEGLLAFSVHPGGILTPLQRHLPKEEMVALGWIDETGGIAEAAKPFFKSPEAGAATSVWCAVESRLAGRGGAYCEDCDIAEIACADAPPFKGVAPWAVDEDSAERLWQVTEDLLGS